MRGPSHLNLLYSGKLVVLASFRRGAIRVSHRRRAVARRASRHLSLLLELRLDHTRGTPLKVLASTPKEKVVAIVVLARVREALARQVPVARNLCSFCLARAYVNLLLRGACQGGRWERQKSGDSRASHKRRKFAFLWGNITWLATFTLLSKFPSRGRLCRCAFSSEPCRISEAASGPARRDRCDGGRDRGVPCEFCRRGRPA